MFLTQIRLQDTLIHINISQQVLDFSYPNQRFEDIAKSTFEQCLGDIKEKLSREFIDSFLQKTSSLYFLIAHVTEEQNFWEFYDSKYKTPITLENHLNQRFIELDFSKAIINVCNPDKHILSQTPTSTMYWQTDVGNSIPYSRNDVIVSQ